MKRVGQILASLVIGTAFLFAMNCAGLLATFLLMGKTRYGIVWLVAGHYIPFFVGGFVLAQTSGFQWPRILVPLCAFLAIVILVFLNAHNTDELEFYLPFLAIPIAFAGCRVAQRFLGIN